MICDSEAEKHISASPAGPVLGFAKRERERATAGLEEEDGGGGLCSFLAASCGLPVGFLSASVCHGH